MEYRGIKFEVVQGSLPTVWKWAVKVGDPPMLRIGEASDQAQATARVRLVIDRALAIQETRQAR
jgi:hypothetical protein